MKHLLVVYHSKTGRTARLVDAFVKGARDPQISGVEVRALTAAHAAAEDLLWAEALLLATPENFGYMSGALKDFFDRTFYEVEGRMRPLPYALIISAGNDGSGAQRAISRIAPGYPLLEVQAALIARGDPTEDHLTACHDLGMTMAAGLEAGIF